LPVIVLLRREKRAVTGVIVRIGTGTTVAKYLSVNQKA
jgi:hypothetical protein